MRVPFRRFSMVWTGDAYCLVGKSVGVLGSCLNNHQPLPNFEASELVVDINSIEIANITISVDP